MIFLVLEGESVIPTDYMQVQIFAQEIYLVLIPLDDDVFHLNFLRWFLYSYISVINCNLGKPGAETWQNPPSTFLSGWIGLT